MRKQTVLITGAMGNVGRKLQAGLGNEFDLMLMDLPRPDNPPAVIGMDLSVYDSMIVDFLKPVDAIVHLAASPDEKKSWAQLVPPNMDALCNLFVAASLVRVPRIVFFSSNHAMGGYQHETGEERWLTTSLPPKPGTHIEFPPGTKIDSTPYGSMKLFGERLGFAYAASTGGVFIAIRSGWVIGTGDNRPSDLPADGPEWYKRMWFSTQDLCQLVRLAITANLEPGTAEVVNGMSDNDGMVWDLEHTREVLGYVPVDGMTLSFQDRNIP